MRADNRNKGEIIIYQTDDGQNQLEVCLGNETVWLTQKQIAELFQTEWSVLTKHINNVFKNWELEKAAVCANFAHTAADGKTYQANHYNLDVIIAVGYRVNAKRGTQFRFWATSVLKDHLKNFKLSGRARNAVSAIVDCPGRGGFVGHTACLACPWPRASSKEGAAGQAFRHDRPACRGSDAG